MQRWAVPGILKSCEYAHLRREVPLRGPAFSHEKVLQLLPGFSEVGEVACAC